MRAWLAALLLAATPAWAWAAPMAVPIGGVRIGLDAPAGFADTTFTGSPRLQQIAQSLTSASNRILLFAISDDDLHRFMQGDQPLLRRFMIVVTPRALEERSVTTDQFDAFTEKALRGLAKPPRQGDMLKYLDAQPRGKTSLLGELRRDTTVVSVLQGTRLPEQRMFGSKPDYLFSTATLLNLRGKALSLSVYTHLDSAQDLDWLKAVTARWIADLERLNAR